MKRRPSSENKKKWDDTHAGFVRRRMSRVPSFVLIVHSLPIKALKGILFIARQKLLHASKYPTVKLGFVVLKRMNCKRS